jgi:hypothetical protein
VINPAVCHNSRIAFIKEILFSRVIYSKFAIKLAVAFFIAGTILLGLFYFEPSLKNAMLAYQFTVGAIIVNWLFALFLLFAFLRKKLTLKQLLTSLGAMAVNIPIGIFYSSIMVWLLSYARITIENSTPDVLENIRFTGCDAKQIEDLTAGEGETIWIKIKNGCDVVVEYERLQSTHRELIVDSLSAGKGFKMTYFLK